MDHRPPAPAAPAATPAARPAHEENPMPATTPAPRPLLWKATPVGNPDAGRGATARDAIIACRARGWDGPIDLAYDGTPAFRAAPGWLPAEDAE